MANPLLSSTELEQNMDAMMLGDRQAAGRVFSHALAVRDQVVAFLAFIALSSPIAFRGATGEGKAYDALVKRTLVDAPGSIFQSMEEVDRATAQLIDQQRLARALARNEVGLALAAIQLWKMQHGVTSARGTKLTSAAHHRNHICSRRGTVIAGAHANERAPG